MKKKKIIFFELNEVPLRIFEESFKYLSYKSKLSDFNFLPTIVRDNGHLSPWTTWSTVHRGVLFSDHQIGDLGQNITKVNEKYPPIWITLKEKGLSVGVFGSLHSSQLSPNTYSKYSFYIPDVFSTHNDCYPDSFRSLQKLNLYLSRKSARVVRNVLPTPSLFLKSVYSYFITSFSVKTCLKISCQLVDEILFPWKKIRRRTIQSDILFDGYFKFLKKKKPNFSTFFTNHVASSMHRFWEASFPKDYKKLPHKKSWINRYKNEIKLAMKSTSKYINKLTEFVDKNPDYELWIISSMGQAACEGYTPQKQFWFIKNLKTFVESIVGEQCEIYQGPAMVPLYSICGDEEIIERIKSCFKKLSTNASFKIRTTTPRSISFYFHSIEDNIYLKKDNQILIAKGLELIPINEHTSSSAYHVPEGIFYRYGKSVKDIDKNLLVNGKLPIDLIKNLILKEDM